MHWRCPHWYLLQYTVHSTSTTSSSSTRLSLVSHLSRSLRVAIARPLARRPSLLPPHLHGIRSTSTAYCSVLIHSTPASACAGRGKPAGPRISTGTRTSLIHSFRLQPPPSCPPCPQEEEEPKASQVSQSVRQSVSHKSVSRIKADTVPPGAPSSVIVVLPFCHLSPFNTNQGSLSATQSPTSASTALHRPVTLPRLPRLPKATYVLCQQ